MNHLRHSLVETLALVLALFIVFACATTPKQKQLLAIDTFNGLYKKYLDIYDQQTPKIQAEWRDKIDPEWKAASDAIKEYASIKNPISVTAQEKASIYTTALSTATKLLLKYGVDIKEE